ncbi:MAG: hypothetical protein FJX35_23515 [Alphaproteobacteria bacterium]|nr:hypothetical protein [Alphaproteobacteria bacterium]
MASDLALAPLVASGFVLGWSVAWPPGPINAEIARRAVARGFFSAVAVGLGACAGDALWALAVVLGAGLLVRGPVMTWVLGTVSVVLLLVLAFQFLRAALAGARAWRGGTWAARVSRFDSARAGFLLGLVTALTSPWNVAFWIAVAGRPDLAAQGIDAALVLAAAVIIGAATWVLVMGTLICLFRARLDGPLWDVTTHGATGLLMVYFAWITTQRLSAL